MVFFMVFIARCKAADIDTMRQKLSFAWYQRAWFIGALEQSGNRQYQHSVVEKQYCFSTTIGGVITTSHAEKSLTFVILLVEKVGLRR
ncbi:MAG: hypothetical protein WBR56_10635 [Sedimenticolaceae bacterium]